LNSESRRIATRIALAEADYEAAYQAASKVSPPGLFTALASAPAAIANSPTDTASE
jgi:hypothetical protein